MSLNYRIILSATLVLIVFITLIAITLDRANISQAETALRDKMTSQLYILIAAAEVDEDGILMPGNELDALLGLPSSGIYAFITSSSESILWRSSSTLGANPPKPVFLSKGVKQFSKTYNGQHQFYSLAYGVNWAVGEKDTPLTFNLSTDLGAFNQAISQYRTTLWSLLIAMALLLLTIQAVILRWGLAPLRKVEDELNHIETGKQNKILNQYPQEINRLTHNINKLLEQEQAQKTRYRDAMGNLAHSLKTPLAVLQSQLQKKPDTVMQEQIARMNTIVEYQLQRAATVGASGIGKNINIHSTLQRILTSLNKVYQDKAISVHTSVDEALVFKGDEGDLMELLGNLLDNAYKWSNTSITVSANRENEKVTISIIDDGPGIAKNKIEQLIKRGQRADQNTAGHGIGLSIVQNILQAYQGELTISENPSGGTKVTILL